QMRTKFIGTFKVSGTATPSGGTATTFTDQTLVVSASSSSDITKILFVFLGTTLTGTVSSSTALTFESQTVNTSYTYSGTGSLSGTNISFNLTEVDAS